MELVPPAKALNTAAVVVLAIWTPTAVAVAFARGVTVVKVVSLAYAADRPAGLPHARP